MASTNALQARRIPTKRPAGVPCPEQTGQRSPYRPSLITHCSTRHKRSWPAMRKPADAIANMTISLWVDDCGAVSVVVACLATSTCTGIAGTGVPSNRIKTGGRRTEAEQRRLEQTQVEVAALRDYCARVRANLQHFNMEEKQQALEALDIRVTWHPEKPLHIRGSIPVDIASNAPYGIPPPSLSTCPALAYPIAYPICQARPSRATRTSAASGPHVPAG